jgi:hypothetical protein
MKGKYLVIGKKSGRHDMVVLCSADKTKELAGKIGNKGQMCAFAPTLEEAFLIAAENWEAQKDHKAAAPAFCVFALFEAEKLCLLAIAESHIPAGDLDSIPALWTFASFENPENAMNYAGEVWANHETITQPTLIALAEKHQ